MKTYQARFNGREKDARLNLYDRFDHITGLQLNEIYPPLTAYRIIYEDGSTSETNMAAGVTLEDAQKYFIGKYFNLGVFPVEKMVQAVNVEVIP